MDGFMDAFLAGRWKDRWRSLLAMHPKRWSGIQLATIGEPGQTRPGVLRKWRGELADLSSQGRLAERLHDSVQLLRLGHDPEPGVATAELEDVLNGKAQILEGVVSVVPGRLAIVLDHEGNVYICQSERE